MLIPYTTEQLGVSIIKKDDEVVGIIYNDTKARCKRMYSCVAMDEETIVNIIGGYYDDTIK